MASILKNLKAYLPDHKATAVSLLILVVVLSLMLSLPSVTAFDHETPIPHTVVFIEEPIMDEPAAPLAIPEPFSIQELQAFLASFDNSSSFSTIGGYTLSPHETDMLRFVLTSIETQDYHVSFVMMDINTGWGVAYNADDEFYSASSIKGPYVASVTSAEPGSLPLWGDYMYYAVQESDNDAFFSLRMNFGDDPLMKWCEEAGVDTAIAEEWFPYYSARSLSKLWLRTYEYFESGSVEIDEVKTWYYGSLNSPISLNLGSVFPVYTKAGWIIDEEFSSTIDAGIVYAGTNPYLMIIMSDAPSDLTPLEPLVVALDGIHDYLLFHKNLPR